MDLPEIILRLRAHPDAQRKTPATEPTRVEGFQCLVSFPSGAHTAVFHWGNRPFTSQAELERWLKHGGASVPASRSEASSANPS